ncbi:MAG: DUF3500 domain-containing protein [Planctomycetes bacterium]|nr:DUF3500 domain-containing protein [Planctomycetota bacterium]
MTPADKSTSCPDCINPPTLARRDFIRVVGTSATVLAVGGLTPLQKARAARAEKKAEAEALVFELFKTMDGEQKKKLVLPWDAGAKGGVPARLMTHNGPANKDSVIGLGYDKKQVELLDKIFHSICNGEEGYKRLSRNNKFDNSGSFESSGALLYGEPVEGKKFSLVFSSHHLTVRCDGNSEEGTAFGGPLYYGHSPKGFATTNVFNYQAKAVGAVFESLTEDQKKTTLLDNRKWADGVASVKLPPKDVKAAGLKFADMTKEQKELTEKAMKELVSPYRKEDGDEVMEIIKANGGMEKISLAFYKDEHTDKEGWSFWRLEGPGFVWSFRALEHIHTFVNISSKLA